MSLYNNTLKEETIAAIFNSRINMLPPVKKYNEWYLIDAEYISQRYRKKSKNINLLIEDFIEFINQTFTEYEKNKSRELLPVGRKS